MKNNSSKKCTLPKQNTVALLIAYSQLDTNFCDLLLKRYFLHKRIWLTSHVQLFGLLPNVKACHLATKFFLSHEPSETIKVV